MIKIKKRIIGNGNPTYMIAEMSANHAGSIERAKEIIHAAKAAGADCVKIQTYTPDTLTIDCDKEYFQIGTGTWEGENLYQLYGKAYTPWDWQQELKEEADKIGIDFFSTPFDSTSVDFLESIGVEFYKIASFELVDLPLIAYVAAKGKPMILSTGMATVEEINEAVEIIKQTGNENYALLKCSSAYPAVSEDMNLNTILDMKERFQVPIGLSDHSMGSLSAITAVALGATIIEKHFCISREIDNPDASFSMTPEEFKSMVEDVRNVERAKGSIQYGISQQETNNHMFRRSLFVVKDMKKGEKFTQENTRSIRPGHGMKPKYLKVVIGQKSLQDIERGTPLHTELIEQPLFRTSTIEDSDILFRWKNDKETRVNSACTKEVTLEEHTDWYQKILADTKKTIYILQAGEELLGQGRLEEKQNIGIISYSVNSFYRNSGYGTILLERLEEKAKTGAIEYLEGTVRITNIGSQRCFEKCNYVIKSKGDECITYRKQLGE